MANTTKPQKTSPKRSLPPSGGSMSFPKQPGPMTVERSSGMKVTSPRGQPLSTRLSSDKKPTPTMEDKFNQIKRERGDKTRR